ncbi:hypothetical protein ED312_17990 [Sinomicrobium pectinilyticum]|uniref:Uncharacterized protein n=1 Tax=Sinomicrobium pectinilyticum TaxID=1084421 RepID=A0A3N0E1Y3_SINP1|nr:hypothetical protein ED312_17990 [Sinomicrobium pectinilyticum]
MFFRSSSGPVDLNAFDIAKQYQEEKEDAGIRTEILFRCKKLFIPGLFRQDKILWLCRFKKWKIKKPSLCERRFLYFTKR